MRVSCHPPLMHLFMYKGLPKGVSALYIYKYYMCGLFCPHEEKSRRRFAASQRKSGVKTV